jgi:hypothetical protein
MRGGASNRPQWDSSGWPISLPYVTSPGDSDAGEIGEALALYPVA